MTQNADTDHTAADAKPAAASRGHLADTAKRIRLARAPGILFLTAALMLPISGAMAFDLDPSATLPPEPDVAAPAEDPLATPATTAAPPAVDDAPPATTARHPGVVTGDQVDHAEREAFLEWVAAQQADGKHRGIAVYTSW